MPIEQSCTTCGQPVLVPDSFDGLNLKCPACQTLIDVAEIHQAEMVIDDGRTPVADAVGDTAVDIPVAGFASFDGNLGYSDDADDPYRASDRQATIKPHDLYPLKEISPDVVQIGTVLTTAWDRSFSHFGISLLLGLIWTAATVVPLGLTLWSYDRLLEQGFTFFGNPNSSTTTCLMITFFLMIFLPVLTWLGDGAIRIGLKVCRNQDVELREITSGPTHWKSLLAVGMVYLVVGFVFIYAWFLFEYPSPFYHFQFLDPNFSLLFALELMFTLFVAMIMMSIPCLIPVLILMRYILAPFLIVERGMNFSQAMKQSAVLMVGNKMIVFVIGCVTQIIFTAALPLTFGIAIVLLIPFWVLTASTVYLFITGQILPVRGY